jgi:hypothetical protein
MVGLHPTAQSTMLKNVPKNPTRNFWAAEIHVVDHTRGLAALIEDFL